MKSNFLHLIALCCLPFAAAFAQSKLTLAKAEVPVTATTWLSAYENSYTYSNGGALLTDLWQERNDLASNLENVHRSSYSNNLNGQPTLCIYENWEAGTNAWLKNNRRQYTYNSSGNLSLIQYSEWDATAQTWLALSQDSTFTYTNGKLTLMIARYDYGSGMVNEGKAVYTYNTNGSLQKIESAPWNSNTNAWMPADERKTFTYNTAGKATKEVSELYDYAATIWYVQSEENHTFDATGRETLYLQRVAQPNVPIYNFFKEEFTTHNAALQPTLGNTFIYDTDLNEWNPFLRNTYIYQNFVGIEENMVDTQFGMIFPNPAAERVTIRLNEHPTQSTRMQIFNSLGMLVQTNELRQQETTLSLNDLTSGMYIIHITQGGSSQNIKLQIVH